MTNRIMLIALLAVAIIATCAMAWDGVVAANTWNVSMGGNYSCNESILYQECKMLEDEDLEGMYKGLTFIGNSHD